MGLKESIRRFFNSQEEYVEVSPDTLFKLKGGKLTEGEVSSYRKYVGMAEVFPKREEVVLTIDGASVMILPMRIGDDTLVLVHDKFMVVIKGNKIHGYAVFGKREPIPEVFENVKF